jgi:hypothetical protein
VTDDDDDDDDDNNNNYGDYIKLMWITDAGRYIIY